jgi:hypothetical protein
MRWCREDCGQPSLAYTAISRIIGIVVFLILIVILNILIRQVSSPFFHSFVFFLNANLWLVLLFSIFLMFGDLLRAVFFPLNLPYPLFSGTGSVLFLMFLFRFMDFIDRELALGFFQYIGWIYYLLAPILFLIVLACGYIDIFRKVCCPRRAKGEPCPGMVVGSPVETREHPGKSGLAIDPGAQAHPGKSWEEIAAEFRELVYDIILAFRTAIRQGK